MRKQRGGAMDSDSIFELEIETSSQASVNASEHGLFDGHSVEETDGYRRHSSRRDSKSAPLQVVFHSVVVMQSTSIPIAIPAQLMRIASPAGSLGSPADTFVPPHLHAVRSTQKQHVAESLPITTSAQIRKRNRVFQSTGFLPSGLEQGFLVSRTSTQPHIPEHSSDLGTDDLPPFKTQETILSQSASCPYSRRMSLPAQPSAQKHVPTPHHAQRSYRLHLR